MTNTELHRLMEDTALLSVDTLDTLQQVIEEFPYFHTARMLYLKNLAVVDTFRFAAELKKMSVTIPDRRKLFAFIEGEKYEMAGLPEAASETSLTDTFALIDNYLLSVGKEEETAADTSLLFQPSASSDYIHWSLTRSESAEKNESAPPVQMKHQDLIDDFIRKEEQKEAGTPFSSSVQSGKDDYVPAAPDDISTMEATGCFTETLARIYVKQKRYEKALQIIKNLSLKYPEKNVYFADQIRFLEKLIINTKK